MLAAGTCMLASETCMLKHSTRSKPFLKRCDVTSPYWVVWLVSSFIAFRDHILGHRSAFVADDDE